MSLLQQEELEAALDADDMAERLFVVPLLDRAKQVNQGSIDLRLGTEFIEVRRRAERAIDPFAETAEDLRAREERIDVPFGESLVLHPGQFVLGATMEYVRLPPTLAGQVLGRSSWGRLGLVVATAVTVQPGFAGSLTLELVNTGNVPILLYPGLRVAQLTLWRTIGPTAVPYAAGAAKYKAPLGPQSSRIGWEAEELERLKRIGRTLEQP